MKCRLTLGVIWLLILVPIFLPAQDNPLIITTVHQQTSEPLPDVTVVKNGQIIGKSDEAGKITLPNVSVNDRLTFTHVGFTSHVWTVTSVNQYTVAMVPIANNLDEVVVIGYGFQKKSNVSTAISTVKGDQLENMPVVRLENSLQGRVSGLTITTNSGQPGAGAVVRVRGTTTIGNSNPLYIVDGVQIDGGIEFLNQADIASIDVMKDAASASIYGARAANGVILVTTKRGVQGKTSVNYHGYLATQAPTRQLPLLNAREYATLMNEARVASGMPILFDDVNSLGEGTNWQEHIFNNSALMNNHELSLSSGSERSTYYTSMSYFQQDGIVASDVSNFERFTIRFNSTHKISKRVEFGSNIAYTRINAIGIETNSEWGSPLNRAINIDPITPLVEKDPAKYNALPYTNENVLRDANGFPYGISSYVTSEIVNPVAALQTIQSKNVSDKVVANGYLDIELLKGLHFRSSMAADLAFWGGQNFNPVYYLNSSVQQVRNSYSANQNRGLFWTFENTLSYNKDIGYHNFTLLGGTTALKNRGQMQSGTLFEIPARNLSEASLQFNVPRDDRDFGGSEYENALSSLFGRLIYSYDDKYLFTALVRRDGSSRFGSNNKYGNFPAFSAGWIISRENFFESVTAIDFLKVRASWGVTGNDRIDDFRYLSTVSGGRDYSLGLTPQMIIGVSPNRLSNPDLKWEETTQTNIGFDVQFLRYFNASFDWFQKKTTGMLLEVDVPGYVGNNGPVGNIADLDNKGIEIELGFNKKVGSVDLSFTGNASYVKNEIIYLGDDKEFLPGQVFGPQQLPITRTILGYPIGSFFGLQTAGIFQNMDEVNNYTDKDGKVIQPLARPGDFRFVDINGDGIIDNDDRTVIGNPTPSWTFGFTANAKWKQFDLMVFGQGVQGNQIFNAIRRFDLPMANWTTRALNRWTGEGTSNTHPRMVYTDLNRNYSQSSDFFLEDGSYFRIKTIQLGYQLPVSLLQRAGIQRARVYVMANNLITFTKYSGFDPEVGGGSLGVDRGFYPQARAFFFGLNLGF